MSDTEPLRMRERRTVLFPTRRARILVALALFTLVYILIGFWAGLMTEGIVGALRIGGISIIQAMLAWACFGGLIALISWIWKGEPRGR